MSETVFKREKKERNYTVLDNTFIKDVNLSWKAKGLMTYLLSLPDTWEIHLSELQKHATDGRDSLQKAIKELVQKGYLIKEQTRSEKGVFQANRYIVVENPSTDIPLTENPSTENPQLLNTNRVNTKELNTDINSSDTSDEVPKTQKQEKKDLPQEAKDLTEYLYNSCKAKDSHFKRTEKQLESWTIEFERLHRLNGREWQEIERVLKWARNNDFWRKNILSAKTFREKYDSLYAKMIDDKPKYKNNNPLAKQDAEWSEKLNNMTQEEIDNLF